MTIREKLDEIGRKLVDLDLAISAEVEASRATLDAYAKKDER